MRSQCTPHRATLLKAYFRVLLIRETALPAIAEELLMELIAMRGREAAEDTLLHALGRER